MSQNSNCPDSVEEEPSICCCCGEGNDKDNDKSKNNNRDSINKTNTKNTSKCSPENYPIQAPAKTTKSCTRDAPPSETRCSKILGKSKTPKHHGPWLLNECDNHDHPRMTSIHVANDISVECEDSEHKKHASPALFKVEEEDETNILSPHDWKDMQFRKLGRDNYCPGTIQDAAEGNINFNALSLLLMKETFGTIPRQPGAYAPYSLLEIFDRRIKSERVSLKAFLGHRPLGFSSDIDAYFNQKSPNDTNRAISCLIKSEHAINFGRKSHVPSVDLVATISQMGVELGNDLYADVFYGTILPMKKSGEGSSCARGGSSERKCKKCQAKPAD